MTAIQHSRPRSGPRFRKAEAPSLAMQSSSDIADTSRRRRFLRGLAAIFGVVVLSASLAAPASAAPWHTGTLPYAGYPQTSCASSKVLLHTYYIGGGAMRTYYSTACQTNWIEWSGPNVCTFKRIKADGGNWTAWEKDQATWSYSQQVYAPGTTRVDIEIAVSTSAYANGKCIDGTWDYTHDIGQHRWYSMT